MHATGAGSRVAALSFPRGPRCLRERAPCLGGRPKQCISRWRPIMCFLIVIRREYAGVAAFAFCPRLLCPGSFVARRATLLGNTARAASLSSWAACPRCAARVRRSRRIVRVRVPRRRSADSGCRARPARPRDLSLHQRQLDPLLDNYVRVCLFFFLF